MTAMTAWPVDGVNYSGTELSEIFGGLVEGDGMVKAPSVAAVPASWKVEVGPFLASSGGLFSGLSAAEQYDIPPATGIPAGQARIDLIVWDPVSSALARVAGTVATSPTVPSPGLAEPVLTARVNAGDGMLVAARVAPAFKTARLVRPVPVKYKATFDGTGTTERGAATRQLIEVTAVRGGRASIVGSLQIAYPATGVGGQIHLRVDGAIVETLRWHNHGVAVGWVRIPIAAFDVAVPAGKKVTMTMSMDSSSGAPSVTVGVLDLAVTVS